MCLFTRVGVISKRSANPLIMASPRPTRGDASATSAALVVAGRQAHATASKATYACRKIFAIAFPLASSSISLSR
jgi:hypothetical protein